MKRRSLITSVLCLLAVTVCVAGCEKRRDSMNPVAFNDDHDAEHVLSVVVDLSGSFEDLMAEQGKAHAFLLQVIDRYFRDRLGTNDRVIVAQISATERALLWEGTPVQLRREFPTPEAFRDMLRAKANPMGSRVNDAVSSTIEHVMTVPGVASGRTKSAIFVLSDMLENSPNPQESEQRLDSALATYGRRGGVFGIYYCDQLVLPAWRQRLADAGFREFHVESEIVGTPTLPSFE